MSDSTRCPEHARTKDKARGTRQQRGYGTKHERLRDEWQRRIDQGKKVYCWRCDRRIATHWHLGHCDDDRTIYHGPECVSCNVAVNAHHACPHPSHN